MEIYVIVLMVILSFITLQGKPSAFAEILVLLPVFGRILGWW